MAGDRLENLRGLKTANIELAFTTAFAALLGGNFQQAFAIELGATPRLLALIAALPAVIGILQIPGSVAGDRASAYKRFVAFGFFLHRFWWLPVIFLPLASATLPKMQMFIACIMLSAISLFFVNATYNAWLSFLVPESHRGWYFSRRFAIATVVSVLVAFPAALGLDWMHRMGNYRLGFMIIFGLGVTLGFIGYLVYLRMPDTRREEAPVRTLRQSVGSLWQPVSDSNFRRLLVFMVFFVLGQAIAAPFFFPYGRLVLELQFYQFQILGAFTAAASLGSAGMWGYLSDKYGNKPVLFASGLLLCIAPFVWALTYPQFGFWNYVILAVGHLSAGFAWTGVAVGQGNIILAASPPAIRAQAIGLSQALVAIVSFLSQMLGGEIVQRTIVMMGDMRSYHLLFIINGSLRIFAVALLFFVHEPRAAGIRGFMRQVAGVRPSGVRAMRRLSAAGSERQKEEAIRQIASARMSMAETELSRLLMDPSPRLRREAAEALAKVGGREALDAIIALIERHPHLAEEEMIETIISIGDESAASALVSLLENPSSALRRASAKALGKLRSPTALEALVSAAEQDEDVELRRAAIQALRQIGDPVSEPAVLAALHDDKVSVRVAAAEAAAELRLRKAAPILRSILQGDWQDAHAELAYALGAVGDQADVTLLLELAQKMNSQVARRRSLLGAAQLFGVEAALYRLLVMDSMEVDRALLVMARSGRLKGLEGALKMFHSGLEKEALELLARENDNPKLDIIAKHAPPEGFLLAAVV